MMHRQTALMRFAWFATILLANRLPAQKPTHSRCESVQLRFVDESPRRAARRYREPATGKSYALTDTVALDGHGIQDVYTDPFERERDTVWTVIATVKPAFGDALSAIMANHVEHHSALLIGDEIVQTAVIVGPLRSKVPFRIEVSRPVADSLARRLRAALAPACMDH